MRGDIWGRDHFTWLPAIDRRVGNTDSVRRRAEAYLLVHRVSDILLKPGSINACCGRTIQQHLKFPFAHIKRPPIGAFAGSRRYRGIVARPSFFTSAAGPPHDFNKEIYWSAKQGL